MKLTVQLKLQPPPLQAQALLHTLERANDAANYISEYAWNNRTFRAYDLHKALYYMIKDRFGLSAQVAVRVLAKVADAYKLGRNGQTGQTGQTGQGRQRGRREFKRHGAIAYDDRILAWQLPNKQVSIWTLLGRQRIPFVCDERGLGMLANQQGESDLVYREGTFYLYTTVNVQEPPPGEPAGWLGVDMGIVNIATDSTGNVYSGKHLNGLRHRHRRLRTKLQARGTRGARRLLHKRRRKEGRFARHQNHVISKRIVASAKAQEFGIALENLSGIRERVTARRTQRVTLHSWAFYQLRQYITYKAQLAGVSMVVVDPRNTSRTCPLCGCIDKANRATQSKFLCVSCGFAGFADHIAAGNIARRAAVNQPYCSKGLYPAEGSQDHLSGQSPVL